MKVGFIGAGKMATTFGRRLIEAGHTVVLSNSGDERKLAKPVAVLGPGASAGTKQEAADCDVVILATNWVNVPEALSGIDWRGRILVDGTNAHVDAEPDVSLEGVTRSAAALRGRTSSERVAELARGARVVKSISTIPMSWMQDFSPGKPKVVLFTSGDDRDAKAVVIELIESAGFVSLDLGGLGHRLINSQPDASGCELDEGEVV